jgi:DNA polymerase-1
MRLVYDTETDGLLHQCTRMWVMVTYDLDTGEVKVYLEGDLSWMAVFDEAEALIGHNILGFDAMVLRKLFGYVIKPHVSQQDTLLLSQVLNYRRFGDQGHSLATWGRYLQQPKQEHDDWTQFSPEMLQRCISDVELNVKVYSVLVNELTASMAKSPSLLTYIRAEHAAAKWQALAQLEGWPFDKEKAEELLVLLEAEMQKAYDALSAKLGRKAVAVDACKGEVEVKTPKYTHDGFYHAHTANWFGVQPVEGLLEEWEKPISGPYCRVLFKDLDLDSPADVKIFLYRHGWEPTEWNYKKDPVTKRRTKQKASPKITEDSLELLGPSGKLYPDFLTAKSRASILKTWIECTDEEGMLHGDSMTIGTPSMRMRHSTIVNVPSADSPWGKEMRSLFRAKPGWKLIGCDSSGNQARGLAHYLGNAEFTNTLLNGDVHSFNANILDQVLRDMGKDWTAYIITSGKAQLKKRIERFLKRKSIDKETYLRSGRKSAKKAIFAVKRAAAKRILYAFLFGASGTKLWSYIFNTPDATNGFKLKEGFTRAVPGFKKLLDKLKNVFDATSKFGEGYIVSIAGNKIYVDSLHKLLVYLLQALEKITCASALMLTAERLDAAGIPYVPCIMMHDEIDFQTPMEYSEQAAEIGKQAFADGPKLFGVEIMTGSGKIGDNWYDVH